MCKIRRRIDEKRRKILGNFQLNLRVLCAIIDQVSRDIEYSAPNITAHGEAGYRNRFRFWRPGVRILLGGPVKSPNMQFACWGFLFPQK